MASRRLHGVFPAALATGVGLGLSLVPSAASAAPAPPPAAPLQTKAQTEIGTMDATPNRATARRGRLFALEVQGLVTRELIPTSFLGIDAAVAFGNDTFGLRAGGALLGAPSFRLAANEISNLLAYGMLDACASKVVREHRVRMCMGGELGGWKHFWSGYGQPDRQYSRHLAGTLKGDYRYAFTRNFGLLLGVGLSIPAVGPQFRGHDPAGRPTPVLVPGPVAGTFRIGGTFGVG